MAVHAPLVRDIADRLRRLDIASLVYFHTDHFEPWRHVEGVVRPVGPENVDAIHDFVRATERIDFARRQTLFYKPHLQFLLRRDAGLLRADPEDLVGFLPRTEIEERHCRAGMHAVAALSQHEIQLHIHHETYTANNSHTDPEAAEWFAGPLGWLLDDCRLELAIRLNRDIIARETGRTLDRWFFVHGQWALNASDDTACRITDEIEILMRNGCRGDFTFPAATARVNPRIKMPYFCRPVNEPKGYDRPEAGPEIACGNRRAAESKFFIWASPARGEQCSIDYISERARHRLENTEQAAIDLIQGSYAVGQRLFLKTHAHAMHHRYFEHARSPVFPHEYPATQRLLSVIFDAAAAADIEVRFLTAGEVYDLLIGADAKPNLDLAAAYLQPTGPLRPRFRSGTPVEPAEPAEPAAVAAAAAAASGEVEKEPVAAIGPGAADLQTAGPEQQPATAGKSAAAGTRPPESGVDIGLLRETIAQVLQQRIDRLGIRGSGAYDNYSAKLRQGFPIPSYELAALDIVRQRVPRLTAYHDIGSGIGSLAFLLALNGCRAVGIEHDKRRHETAVAIWSELAARSGTDPERCRLVFGAFPGAVADDERSRSIAIMTDFTSTQTEEQRRAIIAGLRRYSFVLLDLQRFCTKRDTRKAQLELLAELELAGLLPIFERFDPAASDYAFVLFDNEGKARPESQSAWSRLVGSWRGTGGREPPATGQ